MTAKRTERQLRHLKELRAQTKATARTSAGQVQDLSSHLVRQIEKDKRYSRLQQWQQVAAVSYAEGISDGWQMASEPAPKSIPAPKKHESGAHPITSIPPAPSPLRAASTPRAHARVTNGRAPTDEIEKKAVLIARVVELLQHG